MSGQFQLDFDVCKSHHHGNEESVAAFLSANRDNRRRMVYDFMVIRAANGATADECCAHFRMNHNAIAPRLTELKVLGMVVKTNRRRETRQGCLAAVLVAKEFA